jgi:hypothetical protein
MVHFVSRLFGFTPPLSNTHQRERRVRLSLERLEDRLAPANIPPVTTTADDPKIPIMGQVTLRDAINQANADGGRPVSYE